ncbi:unnamed protein product [Closterium sp. NIES-53]
MSCCCYCTLLLLLLLLTLLLQRSALPSSAALPEPRYPAPTEPHCPTAAPTATATTAATTVAAARAATAGTTAVAALACALLPTHSTGLHKAAALGAKESTAALGASESAAALGARTSPATGPASAEALHTFTLDSGASRCFFRDCTTLTPLATPVPVSLANPAWGPVVARASTVLPCPTLLSGSLSGLHLPTFSTNLVSNAAIQDVWVDTFNPGGQCVVICTCSWTGRDLSTSMPSLPRSPAPPCLPCVKGRQRAAPHSSDFPPTIAPLQTLHMDVWGPAPVSGTDQERYFLLVVDDYTCYTTVFPLRRKADVSGLSSRTLRCVFLGFPTNAPSWQFYHPRERRVFSSQDVTFDESVCFYRLHTHASHPVPLAPLFLVPVPPW